MNNKVLSCLIAGALSATLALAPPALARGGGGHGGGGGGHGGMGGGMHGGGMGMHAGGMGGGMHFGGSRFAGPHFAHAGFSPRFSRVHRFHRFAFFGAPYAYASYDSCWRRAWTPYGLQWVNVCGDYGY
jgi:hypothetical protein